MAKKEMGVIVQTVDANGVKTTKPISLLDFEAEGPKINSAIISGVIQSVSFELALVTVV